MTTTQDAAPNELRLAAISMTTTDDKPGNIARAVALVEAAAAQGANWVQLPEMFPFMGSYDRIYEMAELAGGPLYQTLSSLAKTLGIVLFAGTVGERPDLDQLPESELRNRLGQRKVFNTAYVFGRSGELLAKYRKIHLFNLYGDDGLPRYCESDGYLAGHEPIHLTVDGLNVGMTICYDLRFPQLFDQFGATAHPDVLAVPSAFTKGTGTAHWELLLRARAVERQAYVFAANQTGTHGPGKESFGHSMVIDPWGSVLADTGEQPGIAMATLSRRTLADMRSRLPALANRRPEIYRR